MRHFCGAKSVKKIEKIQERALRIFYSNFFSDFEVKRLRTLAMEVFKTLNNMNSEYMKEIFHKTAFTTYRHLNLEVNKNHTTKYGNKSLRCLMMIKCLMAKNTTWHDVFRLKYAQIRPENSFWCPPAFQLKFFVKLVATTMLKIKPKWRNLLASRFFWIRTQTIFSI